MRRMKRTPGWVCWILVAIIVLSGCKIVDPQKSERATRKNWDRFLRDGYNRTNYDRIKNFDGTTRIDGYRLWQGWYRGVPIALYSCVVQQPYVSPTGGGIKSMSIILAVEEGRPLPTANAKAPVKIRVTIASEKTYEVKELDTSLMVDRPSLMALESQVVAAGRIKADVRETGGGKLGVTVNVLKVPTQYVFDLEKALAERKLSGEKKIVPAPVWPPYTPEEFSKRMREALAEFATRPEATGGVSLRRWEIESVDHPMWEDADAVKALLAAASDEELAKALCFMGVKDNEDPFYLTRLDRICPLLVKTGEHGSAEVRNQFCCILSCSIQWPKDLSVLEPLLAKKDDDVRASVLAAFANRHKMPSDRRLLRKLAESDNEAVRFWAKQLLSGQ